MTYLHENPVRAELVVERNAYRWSSAREWSGDGAKVLIDGFE
ncbi:MAG TPA: hypothetical protein VGL38_06695 [bacterium]